MGRVKAKNYYDKLRAADKSSSNLSKYPKDRNQESVGASK